MKRFRKFSIISLKIMSAIIVFFFAFYISDYAGDGFVFFAEPIINIIKKVVEIYVRLALFCGNILFLISILAFNLSFEAKGVFTEKEQKRFYGFWGIVTFFAVISTFMTIDGILNYFTAVFSMID